MTLFDRKIALLVANGLGMRRSHLLNCVSSIKTGKMTDFGRFYGKVPTYGQSGISRTRQNTILITLWSPKTEKNREKGVPKGVKKRVFDHFKIVLFRVLKQSIDI